METIRRLEKAKCEGCPRAPNELMEILMGDEFSGEEKAAILEGVARIARGDPSLGFSQPWPNRRQLKEKEEQELSQTKD